jgi:hypothetical protein
VVIDLPEQQHSGVAGHIPAREARLDAAPSDGRKPLTPSGTIRHGGTFSNFNFSN